MLVKNQDGNLILSDENCNRLKTESGLDEKYVRLDIVLTVKNLTELKNEVLLHKVNASKLDRSEKNEQLTNYLVEKKYPDNQPMGMATMISIDLRSGSLVNEIQKKAISSINPTPLRNTAQQQAHAHHHLNAHP